MLSKLWSGRRGTGAHIFLLWMMTVTSAQGRAVPDVNDPLGFFTTVADKLLRSTFSFGVTNIPVCSNGVCVYTPAMQRLLQLSANIYDAGNTNFFPVVFRPLFGNDASSNLFIIGYVQVTNVSGVNDPQLSPPHEMTQLSAAVSRPIVDASGPVNVYGVPWIIGAKKGLPGFNQLSVVNSSQITRKLQVSRPVIGAPVNATNQMYEISISNNVGVSFWNSYGSNYFSQTGSRITIYANDVLLINFTNATSFVSPLGLRFMNLAYFRTIDYPNYWPGSGAFAISGLPSANAFFQTNWGTAPFSNVIYYPRTGTVTPLTSATWDTADPLLPLNYSGNLGFATTNYLQAYILDGNNVVDYVQILGPISVANLDQAFADPDYPDLALANTRLMWSTNFDSQGILNGVANQIYVSLNDAGIPPGDQWGGGFVTTSPTTIAQEVSLFRNFLINPNHNGPGGLSLQVPFTPSRKILSGYLLQANDPLIHYLAGDLNVATGASVRWAGFPVIQNGLWYQSDDSQTFPLPVAPITPVGGRYIPWGKTNQLVFANQLTCKDALAYGSDSWNFPTNLFVVLAGLGQVHRGTPWQTVFLKSANILTNTVTSGNSISTNGPNLWAQWTGDYNTVDAALMAPVRDWRLAGVLMSLLNSNNPAQLFSVNNSNPADWQNILSGVNAYSNSALVVFSTTPLQFNTNIISSNSPQAFTIANAITQARAGANFYSIGDILAVPALSQNSPFLNLGGTGFGQQQMNYGIADWEYEAIPAQLLPLLRPDSIGALMPANGGWNLSFSGADGYAYAVQTSTNLTDWISISTNYPVQGSFAVPVNLSNATNQFFRSALLP